MRLLFLLALLLICNIINAQCPSGDVQLNSQADVDDFVLNYPNCTTINGFLIIDGGSINDISGLSNLSSISSFLNINNTALTTLNGLSSISSIGTSLSIFRNNVLTDISVLSNLTTLSQLSINDNDALINLIGLDNLTTINGLAAIVSNDALTDISGLGNLTSVSGSIDILLNNALVNLSGLDNLTTISGNLRLLLNNSLISLSGLDNLTTINGSLDIFSNSAITSLSGLGGLTTIGVSLLLNNNTTLNNIAELSGVTSIGLAIAINNTALPNLNGLENITSIAGNLIIQDNSVLINLSALASVTLIDGIILINNNNALVSLDGLDNIDHNSITDLLLENSPNLSTCEVQSICNYLAIPSNPATINGNAGGCLSRTEVETACSALPVELISFTANFQDHRVTLQWKTASETNNHGFQLQKSNDGSRWNDLVFIEGQGTSNISNEYKYMDTQPYNGENYYRLKQVDFDGAFEYSEVVSARLDLAPNNIIIHPNPVSNFLTIHLPESTDTQNEIMQIKNMNGQILKEIASSFNSELLIDVSTLPSGVYLIQVNHTLSSKFVKM